MLDWKCFIVMVLVEVTFIVMFSQSVGDIGVIENITLKNFMSHHLFGPFSFGPNVNFIVGNNGSKKYNFCLHTCAMFMRAIISFSSMFYRYSHSSF